MKFNGVELTEETKRQMKHPYDKKESTYRILLWTMIGLVVLMVGCWILELLNY